MLRYDIRRNGKWMFSQGPSEATGEKKVVLCQFKLLTTDAQQAPDMSQTLDAVGPADAIVAGRFVETRPGDTFELRVSGVVPDPDYLRSAEAQQERVTEGQQNLYCSFCGKSQHEVKKLIAGPGVFICDECSDVCNSIIRHESPSPIRSADLVIGEIYYKVQYPQPDKWHPVITTYQYKGTTDDGKLHFKALGGSQDGGLLIHDSDLDSLVDHLGLWDKALFSLSPS